MEKEEKKEREIRFLNSAAVKDKLKSLGLRTSKSFLRILDREVAISLEKYARMAEMDRCKTVLPVHTELEETIKKLSNGLRRRSL